jgi:hypothetical protein
MFLRARNILSIVATPSYSTSVFTVEPENLPPSAGIKPKRGEKRRLPRGCRKENAGRVNYEDNLSCIVEIPGRAVGPESGESATYLRCRQPVDGAKGEK